MKTYRICDVCPAHECMCPQKKQVVIASQRAESAPRLRPPGAWLCIARPRANALLAFLRRGAPGTLHRPLPLLYRPHPPQSGMPVARTDIAQHPVTPRQTTMAVAHSDGEAAKGRILASHGHV